MADLQSFVEDNDTITSLVDYSCSSEEEEEEQKKQQPHLCDSESDTLLTSSSGSANSDVVEEFDINWKRLAELDDTFSDHGSDDDDLNSCTTDNELVQFGRYSWRLADRLNREVYYVALQVHDAQIEESECLELLDKMGCGERFLGCSVEMRNRFLANLNKDEATRIKGMERVKRVVPRRLVFTDI